jgi:hypothetical protein
MFISIFKALCYVDDSGNDVAQDRVLVVLEVLNAANMLIECSLLSVFLSFY